MNFVLRMVLWPADLPMQGRWHDPSYRDGLWVCKNTVCADGIVIQMLHPFEPAASAPPAPPFAAAAAPVDVPPRRQGEEL